MTVEITQQSDCYIIKHKAEVLSYSDFDNSYSALKDLVFRKKQRKIICDLSHVTDCTLSASDFEEMKRAMFHIFINAPKSFQFAVVVKCDSLAQKIQNCHNQIKEAGFLHWNLITDSRNSALAAFSC